MEGSGGIEEAQIRIKMSKHVQGESIGQGNIDNAIRKGK